MKLTEGDTTPDLRLVSSNIFYTPLHRLCAAATFGVVVVPFLMSTYYYEFLFTALLWLFSVIGLYVYIATHTGCFCSFQVHGIKLYGIKQMLKEIWLLLLVCSSTQFSLV